MIRTQIQLTDEQARRLRALAREERVSLAALIRRSVDRLLADSGPSRADLYARAFTVVGAFRDPEGSVPVAEDHDRFLEEPFG